MAKNNEIENVLSTVKRNLEGYDFNQTSPEQANDARQELVDNAVMFHTPDDSFANREKMENQVFNSLDNLGENPFVRAVEKQDNKNIEKDFVKFAINSQKTFGE